MNAGSSNAKAYEKVIRTEQTDALKSIGAPTSAKKTDFTVAFNGFAAKLTPAQAAAMRKAPASRTSGRTRSVTRTPSPRRTTSA